MPYCLLLVSSLLVASSHPYPRINSKYYSSNNLNQCLKYLESFCSYSDDNNDVTNNGVTVNDVPDNDQTINLTVEDSTIINGDIPKQDQCSLDLEARSHDHNHGLEAHVDITKHSNKKKVSVNGLSYRRLLEKEELEDSEENTIVMEDLAVDEISSVTIKHKSGKFSDFIVKLKLVRSQITSTFQILLSLLK